jgi:hypothetical protein
MRSAGILHLLLHLAPSRLTHWVLIGLLPMSDPSRREPPRHVVYELDEALALLADLEDARDALISADRLCASR